MDDRISRIKLSGISLPQTLEASTHTVSPLGTPAPKAGKYPARRVHVGKLRAVMQNAFAVRQHTRRKQRERAVLCSVHPEFALQPPPAVNDELLAVCHMIISSCITVFP